MMLIHNWFILSILSFSTILFVPIICSEMADNYNPNQEIAVVTQTDLIFIQNVRKSVMDLYRKQSSSSRSSILSRGAGHKPKEILLSFLSSTKTRLSALIKILEDSKNECKCSIIQMELKTVIANVEEMRPNGEGRLFVCQSRTDPTKSLELLCLAVRIYHHPEGDVVADYYMATYFYKNSDRKVSRGKHHLASLELKDKIQAYFINELINRDVAVLHGNELFLKG